MEDIYGIWNTFWGNYTVSNIHYALVLGMYALWHLQCSISGPMHHPSSPCGAQNSQSFRMWCITTLVPGGDKGVRLKSNSLKMWVYAEMWGRVLYCLSRFILIVACCKSISHNRRWKYFSTLHSPAIKRFLNVCITIYEFFDMWLLGGTNSYFMSMVAIVRFKAVDALLYMKWKPFWIIWISKSLVKDVKDLIIYLSLLFFIAAFRTVLQPHTYIT